MLSVVLVGAAGRMGRYCQELLGQQADIALVGGVSAGEDLAARLREWRPVAGLDFTVAGLGARHAQTMLECGVRPLIGTSGVTPAEVRALDAKARELKLGGLVVPNFCLGIVLQQRFAQVAARYFPTLEIVEEHHKRKRDAPSGTALDTAQRLAEARQCSAAEIPIHALRLEGLYSNQSIHFGGPGEVLRLVHQTYGLEAFGPGILAALRYLPRAAGLRVGLEHALDQP